MKEMTLLQAMGLLSKPMGKLLAASQPHVQAIDKYMAALQPHVQAINKHVAALEAERQKERPDSLLKLEAARGWKPREERKEAKRPIGFERW